METAARRLFAQGERKAIARAQSYRCAVCSRKTFNGHADHATSFASGGETTLSNAQYLCRSCNLSKGSKSTEAARVAPAAKPSLEHVHLRPWQSEVVGLQIEAVAKGATTYFTAAGVGSGKTIATLALFIKSDFDLIVVVTPRSGIRGSWQSDADRLGLKLETIFSASAFTGDEGRSVMPNGFVVNVQGLAGLTNEMRLLCAKYKVLVVFDEAHHLGAEQAWTQYAVEALGTAAFSVGLSGTPYRGDNSRIYLLDYTAKGNRAVAVPDYVRHAHESIAAGECAAVVCRFVSGEVVKEFASLKAVETFSFADGDYSKDKGSPDAARMSERLRLAAVLSTDWQMGAIKEARSELMRMRTDGKPWAALVTCLTIEQANTLKDSIEARWGDKCKLIVADVDTEGAVAEVIADESYTWVISITKVSEGISIPRLRVGVMLTTTLTRGFFDQFKGRLMRLYGGIPSLQQTAVLFIAADPRLMDMAIESNETMLHSIAWLADDITPEEAVVKYQEQIAESQIGLHGEAPAISEQIIQTRQEDVMRLREELKRKRESLIVDIGSFTLSARAWLDGAVVGDDFVEEEEFLAMRREIVKYVSPRTVVKLSPEAMALMMEVLDEK